MQASSMTSVDLFLFCQVIEDPLQVERIKFAFETENGLIGK